MVRAGRAAVNLETRAVRRVALESSSRLSRLRAATGLEERVDRRVALRRLTSPVLPDEVHSGTPPCLDQLVRQLFGMRGAADVLHRYQVFLEMTFRPRSGGGVRDDDRASVARATRLLALLTVDLSRPAARPRSCGGRIGRRPSRD